VLTYLLAGGITGTNPWELPDARAPYVPCVTVVTGVLSICTLVLFFKVRKTLKLPVTITSPGWTPFRISMSVEPMMPLST
jgi:hypothetical protein